MTEKEIFERIKGAYEVDAVAVVANMIVQAYEIGYSDGVEAVKASKGGIGIMNNPICLCGAIQEGGDVEMPLLRTNVATGKERRLLAMV